MKVFVSSTVYDLIDIRAELEELLRSMGLTPVMSDRAISAFDATPETNSIQCCLLNVERCDAVVLVLDQRYGPRLPKAFDGVSATHLEYRHAKKMGVPVHVFVRDRLQADFDHHRANRGEQISHPWVQDAQDVSGLFELLNEHRKLKSGDSKNWIANFANSVDLKAAVRIALAPASRKIALEAALSRNDFPLFAVDSDTTELGQSVNLDVTARNIANVPAFNFSMRWEEEPSSATQKIIGVGQAATRTLVFPFGRKVKKQLILYYESLIGVAVIETFDVGCKFFPDGKYIAGCTSHQREFAACAPVDFEVSPRED